MLLCTLRKHNSSCSRKHYGSLTWQRPWSWACFTPGHCLTDGWKFLQTSAEAWMHKQAMLGMPPCDSVTWHSAVSVVQLTLYCIILKIFACYTILRQKESGLYSFCNNYFCSQITIRKTKSAFMVLRVISYPSSYLNLRTNCAQPMR